jgi:hypothetical protein
VESSVSKSASTLIKSLSLDDFKPPITSCLDFPFFRSYSSAFAEYNFVHPLSFSQSRVFLTVPVNFFSSFYTSSFCKVMNIVNTSVSSTMQKIGVPCSDSLEKLSVQSSSWSSTTPTTFSSIPYIYKDLQSLKTSQLFMVDNFHYFCEVYSNYLFKLYFLNMFT